MKKLVCLGFLLSFGNLAFAEEKSILDCKGVIQSTSSAVVLSVLPGTKLPYLVFIKSDQQGSLSPADGVVTPKNGKLAISPEGVFSFWTNKRGGIDAELDYFDELVTLACRYNQ